MDRRSFLAIVLCFLVFLGWQKLYIEPRLPHGNPAATLTQAQPENQSGATAVGSQTPNPSQASSVTGEIKHASAPQTREIPTGTGQAILGDGGNFFVGYNLKAYQQGLSANDAAVSIRSVTNLEGNGGLAFDDPQFSYLSSVQGTFSQNGSAVIWTFEDANVKLTREFSGSGAQNFVTASLTAQFKTAKRPNYAFVSLESQTPEKAPEARDRQMVYYTNGDIQRIGDQKAKLQEIATDIQYIGVNSRYFLMAFLPQGPLGAKGLVQPLSTNAGRISLVYPISGNSITIPLHVYFGPKELSLLHSVDPKLDLTVDFGWFKIFAYPILEVLRWIYGFIRNYGVSIILLTLLLKILTYPLTYKSMKSMKEMAKIQPQIQKIREKYKDDKEALNREMLTLMRTHGYNPAAGCLPIVIQMPIFFALYRVLYSSIELYHAPFVGYIHDLAAPDPYYVTPIVLSLTMFVQQKLSPQNAATDPAQQKMMQFMPLMFGAFMLNLPSGLTLYMLTNALASILQQMILNKKFNAGNIKPA